MQRDSLVVNNYERLFNGFVCNDFEATISSINKILKLRFKRFDISRHVENLISESCPLVAICSFFIN